MKTKPQDPGSIPTVTDIADALTGRAERAAATAAELIAAATHEERFMALAKARKLLSEGRDASLTEATLARMAEEFPLAKLTSIDAARLAAQAGAQVTSSHLRHGTGHLTGRMGANTGLLLQIKARLNKKFLTEQLTAGKSYTEIADQVGVHPRTVANHAKKNGVAYLRRSPSPTT